MIVVHHLNNSRSQRVLWLLEELGLDYEIVRYQRDAKTMLAPPALRKVHPLGKSPVITDEGATIAESGAIVEYLVDRYAKGRLAPAPGTPERLRYTYWLHYAEGSAMPPLLLSLIFAKIPKTPMPFFVRPVARGISDKVLKTFIEPQLGQHLDYLENELDKSEWFAGTAFTAADIQMSFPIEAFAARGGLDESKPKLWGWLQRIHARPAYQRALQRGGPYELLS
jgi:glutathione S-transferase